MKYTRRQLIIGGGVLGGLGLLGLSISKPFMWSPEKFVYEQVEHIFGKDCAPSETITAFSQDFVNTHAILFKERGKIVFTDILHLVGQNRTGARLWIRKIIASEFSRSTTFFVAEDADDVEFYGGPLDNMYSCQNMLARFDFDDEK